MKPQTVFLVVLVATYIGFLLARVTDRALAPHRFEYATSYSTDTTLATGTKDRSYRFVGTVGTDRIPLFEKAH